MLLLYISSFWSPIYVLNREYSLYYACNFGSVLAHYSFSSPTDLFIGAENKNTLNQLYYTIKYSGCHDRYAIILFYRIINDSIYDPVYVSFQ